MVMGMNYGIFFLWSNYSSLFFFYVLFYYSQHHASIPASTEQAWDVNITLLNK